MKRLWNPRRTNLLHIVVNILSKAVKYLVLFALNSVMESVIVFDSEVVVACSYICLNLFRQNYAWQCLQWCRHVKTAHMEGKQGKQ